MSPFATLTTVELEFMKLIWKFEPVGTEGLQKAFSQSGRNYTDGGIRRMLSILMKKGFVRRKKVKRAYMYESIVKHEEAADTMVGNLLSRLFDGATPPMIATLLRKGASRKELSEIRRLLGKAERGEL